MTFEKILLSNLDNIKNLVQTSTSLAEICTKLGYSAHGRNTSKLRQLLNDNNVPYLHFTQFGGKSSSISENRTCPVCSSTFSVIKTNKKSNSKVTCSYSCANKFFKTGKNAGSYKTGISIYRRILKDYLNSKSLKFCCVVCGESDDKLVDVHHIDEDRHNNDTGNLIPICVKHHRILHTNSVYNTIVVNAILNHLEIRGD